MRKSVFTAACFIAASLLLGGCQSGMHAHYTESYKHFIFPATETIVPPDAKEVYLMDSLLDIDVENSDSLAGGFAWQTVIGGGMLKKEIKAFTMAASLADPKVGCKKHALTIFTSKEDVQGAWVYTKDHQGTLVMNQMGELALVKSQFWAIKPEKDFPEKWLSRLDLSQPYIQKLPTDSKDWRELSVHLLVARFKEQGLFRVQKDGKVYLSVKNTKELAEIIKNDAVLSSLLYWAVDGLTGFVALPIALTNPVTIPISFGVVKTVTLIPSMNRHGIDRPGFGGYQLDAYHGSVLIRRYNQEYDACFDLLRQLKQ